VAEHWPNVVSLIQQQTPAFWSSGETLYYADPKSGITYLISRLEHKIYLVLRLTATSITHNLLSD
jgi:hypothetical protein